MVATTVEKVGCYWLWYVQASDATNHPTNMDHAQNVNSAKDRKSGSLLCSLKETLTPKVGGQRNLNIKSKLIGSRKILNLNSGKSTMPE